MKAKPKPTDRSPSTPRLNGKETIPDGGQTYSNGTVIEMQAKSEDDDEHSVPGFVFTFYFYFLDRD